MIKLIESLLSKRERVIVGIDGCSCAGKSTLAGEAALIFDGNLIHMDDFFLPPELRTPERLARPGGNVHSERFLSEIVQPLKRGEPPRYRVFDCAVMDYTRGVTMEQNRLTIVEGCYCLLPELDEIYDARVFMSISPERQRERVIAREGERAERFFSEWIPMENRYFEAFDIALRCDMIIEV